jgi:hypothetical protein
MVYPDDKNYEILPIFVMEDFKRKNPFLVNFWSACLFSCILLYTVYTTIVTVVNKAFNEKKKRSERQFTFRK